MGCVMGFSVSSGWLPVNDAVFPKNAGVSRAHVRHRRKS
jgi:hypothetical protein